jgi:hypothetical protein
MDMYGQNVLGKVSGADSQNNETADLVTSWRTKVANFGCDLVQLTADMRLSPLVNPTANQVRQQDQQQRCKAITNDHCK